MGCVSAAQTDDGILTQNTQANETAKTDYPRFSNETINNPYQMNQWLEVQERMSKLWVIAKVIHVENNWIRICSQSPYLQFTAKFHVCHDKQCIRPLGAVSIKKAKQSSKFTKNGFKLLSNIPYNKCHTEIDTIYKCFEYRLFYKFHKKDEFKQNTLSLIQSNEEITQELSKLIENWSQKTIINPKNKNKKASSQDHIIMLSHLHKLHCIVYHFKKNKEKNKMQMQIRSEHNKENYGNKRNITLFYDATHKQYKLIKLHTKTIKQKVSNQSYEDSGRGGGGSDDERSQQNTAHCVCAEYQYNNYKKWDSDQVVNWLKLIEFGRFTDESKYKEDLIENVCKLQIDGSQLTKLNDLTLKSFGLTDDLDIQLIVDNIDELIEIQALENAENVRNVGIVEIDNMNLIDNNNNDNTIGYCNTKGCDDGDGEDFEIPEEYLDPITLDIMTDPVLSVVSGHSFERASISEWIQANHSDPINQKTLNLNQLIPNRTLREAIDRFVRIHSNDFAFGGDSTLTPM